MDLIRHFETQQTNTVDRPRLRAGDIVRVEMKVREGDKERLQVFEGTVLVIRGSGPSATFTVRREAARFAVERIFPVYSPLITSIEIVKRQKVRRSKLGYLRQAGRRRVKEDVASMQRHVQEEAARAKQAAAAAKKAEEAKAQKAAEATAAEKQAEKSEDAAEAEAPEASDEASPPDTKTDSKE